MKEFTSTDTWKEDTEIRKEVQQIYKDNIHVLMDRFNQSHGVHTLQRMYGCGWDDVTGASERFDQYGYDGEDYVALDVKMLSYIAAVPQGMITKIKWDNNRAQLELLRKYYQLECVNWLKHFLSLRKVDIERRAPEVSLLQKDPSSPVVCHATGFYPSAVTMNWLRNGQYHYEDVDLGETLPNEDGTFQKTSTLNIRPEESKKNQYVCMVEHNGKTIRKILTEIEIKSNREFHTFITTYTGINGQTVEGIPEFFAVTTLDGQQIDYYDSEIKKLIPRQDWMKEFTSTDTWKEDTEIRKEVQQIYKSNIHVLMQRFNQSHGVHTLQRMYGCGWDDVTGASEGFDQYGYDGEDYVALDVKMLIYIAAVPQGMITKIKWDINRAQLVLLRQYYQLECVNWLKHFLSLRKVDIERRAPEVSLLQKDPSSPVACHATGFYPSAVTITWLRNGQDHYEDVDLGETLPNEDGTFQRTSTLNIRPEEWKKNQYVCMVEHKAKTIRKILTEDEIKSNRDSEHCCGSTEAVIRMVLSALVGGAAVIKLF